MSASARARSSSGPSVRPATIPTAHGLWTCPSCGSCNAASSFRCRFCRRSPLHVQRLNSTEPPHCLTLVVRPCSVAVALVAPSSDRAPEGPTVFQTVVGSAAWIAAQRLMKEQTRIGVLVGLPLGRVFARQQLQQQQSQQRTQQRSQQDPGRAPAGCTVEPQQVVASAPTDLLLTARCDPSHGASVGTPRGPSQSLRNSLDHAHWSAEAASVSSLPITRATQFYSGAFTPSARPSPSSTSRWRACLVIDETSSATQDVGQLRVEALVAPFSKPSSGFLRCNSRALPRGRRNYRI